METQPKPASRQMSKADVIAYLRQYQGLNLRQAREVFAGIAAKPLQWVEATPRHQCVQYNAITIYPHPVKRGPVYHHTVTNVYHTDKTWPTPVTIEQTTLLRMTCGNEKKFTYVITRGMVMYWTGIGWIDHKVAACEDYYLYPCVVKP